jgi:Methyltransferase domain
MRQHQLGFRHWWTAWMGYALWHRSVQCSLSYTSDPPLLLLRAFFRCRQPCRVQCLRCSLLSGESRHSNVSVSGSIVSLRDVAERAFHKLSRRNRGNDGWQRFRPLVEMAIEAASHQRATNLLSANNRESTERVSANYTQGATLVDVGCDHGLLSACLAVTGCFETVLGIDSSLTALESGAFALHDEITAFRASRMQQQLQPQEPPPPLRLEFRVGSGLQGLRAGEADVICLAGMGARTMGEILTELSPLTEPSAAGSDGAKERYLLKDIDCHTVMVQPTNARPRNLIHLYDSLARMGYAPTDERIAFVGSRWYFSAALSKMSCLPVESTMPGSLLLQSVQTADQAFLLEYLSHYCRWLHNDSRTGALTGGEDEWLNRFDSARIQLEDTVNTNMQTNDTNT